MVKEHLTTKLSSGALAALSQTVGELGCDQTTIQYCRIHGISYFGEVCGMRWGYNGRTCTEREAIKRLLVQYEISPGTDPVALGWRPPYWDDPEWVALMSKPIAEVVTGQGLSLLQFQLNGTSPVGHVLRAIAKKSPTYWRHFQIDVGNKSSVGLRAGMIVPPDWRPTPQKRSRVFSTYDDCLREVTRALAEKCDWRGDALLHGAKDLALFMQTLGVQTLAEVVALVAEHLPLEQPGANDED